MLSCLLAYALMVISSVGKGMYKPFRFIWTVVLVYPKYQMLFIYRGTYDA